MLSVTGIEEIITFLLILAVNYLIMYIVVSSVLTNSGLKSDIKNLQNEILNLKKLIDEKTISAADDRNKDS